MKTNPFHAINVGDTLHKFSYLLLAIEVNAIVCKLLCNNLKLLHALADEVLDLLNDVLHRTTLVLTRNDWYGTISTMAVASL